MASSPVEEIKGRLDIVDVLSRYLPLKRAGRNFKALCPFHAEKTPSFIVFPDSGNWHCFGCGQGGDIFSFVARKENLDFGETLRLLAQRAGVELRQERASPEQDGEHQVLRQCNEAAALFYHSSLLSGVGREARDYLSRRGVHEATVEEFGLGYAPDAPGALLRHLEKAGFDMEKAIAAGLAGRSESGVVYERLRGRLIFPIRDARGSTIGFGGRALWPETEPKYLNSPQTPIFDKGACLYGIDLARQAIRRDGEAVIVEGYMDVVVAHQYGFKNVVATLGTAITERHLDTLKRLAHTIVLALDADAAGQMATARGLQVAREALRDEVGPVLSPTGLVRYQSVSRKRVKVMVLPGGEDPDDVIRRDAGAWRSLASSAVPVVDFVLSRLAEGHDLSDPRGKSEAVGEALGFIAEVTDPVEQAHYLQKLAHLIGVDETLLSSLVRRRQRRSRPGETPAHRSETSGDILEEYYLALVMATGELSDPPLEDEDFARADNRALFHAVKTQLRTGDRPDWESFAAGLDEDLGQAWRRVAEVGRECQRLSVEKARVERDLAALELRKRRLAQQHRHILSVLQDPESHGDVDTSYWVSKLDELRSRLLVLERAQRGLGRVGPIAWRVRQAKEVLGG